VVVKQIVLLVDEGVVVADGPANRPHLTGGTKPTATVIRTSNLNACDTGTSRL